MTGSRVQILRDLEISGDRFAEAPVAGLEEYGDAMYGKKSVEWGICRGAGAIQPAGCRDVSACLGADRHLLSPNQASDFVRSFQGIGFKRILGIVA